MGLFHILGMASNPNEIITETIDEDCSDITGVIRNVDAENSVTQDTDDTQHSSDICNVPKVEAVKFTASTNVDLQLEMETDPNEIQIDIDEQDCQRTNDVLPNPNTEFSAIQDADDTKPSFDMYDVRKAKSIASIASSDAGDLSSWSDTEDEIDPAAISDEDSDVEFEKYLKVTAHRRHNTYLSEHHPLPLFKKVKVQSKFRIQDEFENLPPLEKLSIHCNEKTHLAKIGIVENVVGCVLAVKSTCNCSPLDLDTVLFDKDRNDVGPVADVIGTFNEPTYCIRFNSHTEASIYPRGTEIFYAPKSDEFTKRIVGKEMKTPWRRANPQVESEDEPVFSDDEKEREYQEQKRRSINVRNNARGRGNHNQKKVHFGDNIRGGGHFAGPANKNASSNKRNWDWHRKRPHNHNPTAESASSNIADGKTSMTVNEKTKYPSCSDAHTADSRQPDFNAKTTSILKKTTRPAAEAQPLESMTLEANIDSNNPYAEFGCYGNYSVVQYPNH